MWPVTVRAGFLLLAATVLCGCGSTAGDPSSSSTQTLTQTQTQTVESSTSLTEGLPSGATTNVATSTTTSPGATTTTGTTTAPGAGTTTAGTTTAGTATASESPGSSAASTLVLGGTELGVTQIGAPFDEAVTAVSGVLGQPTQATGVTCIEADAELAWPDLTLAEKDGRLAGWHTTSPVLASPSGVRVGTTVSAMTSLYGDGLHVYPPNSDGGPSFAVDGVDFGGDLTAMAAAGTVTSLYTSFCAGP